MMDGETIVKRLEANDPSLTSVEVNERDLSLCSCDDLAAALTNNCFVESISFSNKSVSTSLLDALSTASNLRNLSLVCAGLSYSQDKARALAGCLSNLSFLETLNISDNPNLGPRGCKLLAESLKKLHLVELKMSNVGMGHFGTASLAPNLPSTLQVFDLSYNKMGNDGVWKLVEYLKKLEKLRNLDVSYNKCLDDGCLELSNEVLEYLQNLEILNLAGNEIGDVGMKALSQAVTKTKITHLYLQDNKISSAGATELARHAISTKDEKEGSDDDDESDDESDDGSDDESDDRDDQSATDSHRPPPASHLQVINLAQNHIGSEGCTEFAEALSQSDHALFALNLSSNGIGDEGAGAFVEALDEITHLQDLDLSHNNDVSEARTRILDMLLKHRAPPTRKARDETESSAAEDVTTARAAPVTMSSPSAKAATEVTELSSSAIQSDKTTQQQMVHDADVSELGHKLLADRKPDDWTELPFEFILHATKNFSAEGTISSGTFGTLHKMEGEKETMFIRKLHLSTPDPLKVARDQVLSELQLLRHPNLQSPIAFARGKSLFVFVYKISNQRPLSVVLVDEASRKSFSWDKRVECVKSVASGLAYLHTSGLGHKASFHGDICAKNIYVDSDMSTFRLVDCGMSRLVATDRARFASMDVVFGTRGYRCPRYERGSVQYDACSDMFSFGVVLAEVLTGRLQGSKTDHGLAWDCYYDILLSKQPLRSDSAPGPIPRHVIEPLANLMALLLNPSVKQRPSSAVAADALSQVEV